MIVGMDITADGDATRRRPGVRDRGPTMGPTADARDGRRGRTRGPRPGAPVRSNHNIVIRIE